MEWRGALRFTRQHISIHDGDIAFLAEVVR
jgi:hypothetical protein